VSPPDPQQGVVNLAGDIALAGAALAYVASDAGRWALFYDSLSSHAVPGTLPVGLRADDALGIAGRLGMVARAALSAAGELA